MDGLRLHYLDWGRSALQPLLLLHGFMAHARVWDEFARKVKDSYHVLALDQRGHGESQWSVEGAYTIDDHFADIAQMVETLDLNDLILIGHSMGGRNALIYVACLPRRVQKLILVDARPGDNPHAREALREHLCHLPMQASSRAMLIRAFRGLYPHLPPETCRHIAKFGYLRSANGNMIPKYDQKMAFLSESAGFTAEDLSPFMENVVCPTLIIRGEHSPFLSRQGAKRMCAAISQARLVEIGGSTHMPAQEKPRTFQKVVLDFLKEPL